MTKWTEVDIYTGLVKKVDEDVPTNFAGQGSKVALPPDLLMKKKKKLIDARTKVYRQHRERLEKLRAQREAKRKSMKEHKGTKPHKHPHEDDEIDEGKYLKYSDLLLQKSRLIGKYGPVSNEVQAINKELAKERKKLGIKEEVELNEFKKGSIEFSRPADMKKAKKDLEKQGHKVEVSGKMLTVTAKRGSDLGREFKDLINFYHGARAKALESVEEEVELDENQYYEYMFRNKQDAMAAKKMLDAVQLMKFDINDDNISNGELIVDAGNKNMSKYHKEIMKKFRPKVMAVEEVVKEGTWHIAKNMTKLKNVMKKPMPYTKSGFNFVAKHIGDDVLFDDLQDLKINADMVPAIKKAMKRLGIKEEITFTEKMQDSIMNFNRESLLAEDNIDVLKNIVKTKSAKPVKFRDGTLKVDMFTASAIIQVYDKVNKSNQEKIKKLANGKKSDMMKLQKMAMKVVGRK